MSRTTCATRLASVLTAARATSSLSSKSSEAASALGMRERQVIRRIVLPQALRVIVPPTGNEVINMLKTTSLVSPTLPNGDFELVSQIISGEHGPHPDLDSDFEVFCEVVVPALT